MPKEKPYLITCPDCGNQYGSLGTHHCKNKPDQSTALLREAKNILQAIIDADERGQGHPFAEGIEAAHKFLTRLLDDAGAGGVG